MLYIFFYILPGCYWLLSTAEQRPRTLNRLKKEKKARISLGTIDEKKKEKKKPLTRVYKNEWLE